MSEQEFVDQAMEDFPDYFAHPNDLRARDVLEACECYYLSGFSDGISGDSEAPTGHFYRIHRWIVITDSQGFRDLDTFDNEDVAAAEFERLDIEYAEWENDENEEDW